MRPALPPRSTLTTLQTAQYGSKSIRKCTRCHSTDTPPGSTSTPTPRLRFAPSPTGHLHLGGLRTALFNYLVARQGNGKWILRIEDTDQSRLVKGAVDSMRRSLDWAGLEYDEGVGAGGSYGPYVQSERLDLYHPHVRKLIDTDHAYECFCSEDDLNDIKQSLRAQGTRLSYDGRCRHLSDEDRVRRKKAGHKFIVRFKDPGGLPDMPRDLVFGQVLPHSDTGVLNHDDFILLKSDGYPTYHLASVVDDHAMKITHVLRGEEWLSSLPKHLRLYEAYGWDIPLFGHLPLLTNANGTKLSKRRLDVTIDSFAEKGYEPEALLNFLALLGWDYASSLQLRPAQPPDEPLHASYDKQSFPCTDTTFSGSLLEPSDESEPAEPIHELFSLPLLVTSFNLEHLTRRKCAVNLSKLDFLNKMTLRQRAGRLGQDGMMLDPIKVGHSEQLQDGDRQDGKGKEELLRRFKTEMSEQTSIDTSLLDDDRYVENVFDAELPRATFFRDIVLNSCIYFVQPELSDPESQEQFKMLDQASYATNIKAVISTVENLLSSKSHKQSHTSSSSSTSTSTALDLTGEMGWDVVKSVVHDQGIKNQSEVLKHMRHALTGRRRGPSVPEIMVLLGAEQSLIRLRTSLEYVKSTLEKTT